MSTSAGLADDTLFEHAGRLEHHGQEQSIGDFILGHSDFSAVLCLAMIERTAGFGCGFDRLPSLAQNFST